jgi:hypothetical protein
MRLRQIEPWVGWNLHKNFGLWIQAKPEAGTVVNVVQGRYEWVRE